MDMRLRLALLKKSEVNQRKKTISVTFCRSGSFAEIIPNVAYVFTKLNYSRAFETAAQINEELKKNGI